MRQRLVLAAAGIGAIALVGGGLERAARQRVAEQRADCRLRDAASVTVQAADFKKSDPRELQVGAQWLHVAPRFAAMATKECELGHRLYDVLSAARPNESFVFSPHALYASSLFALAAANDALIRHALAVPRGEPPLLAEEYAQLKYAYALYHADPLDNELERRFPAEHVLDITLQAQGANRLAPELLTLIHAAEIPVTLAKSGAGGNPREAAALTIHADSSLAAPWYEMPLGERVGTFHEAGGRAKEAPFVRFRGIEGASLPGFPQRITLAAGMWPQGLDVKFISIADGQPTSDFCLKYGEGDQWLAVFTEIPETAIASVIGATESAQALARIAEPNSTERYSCAEPPDAHANVTDSARAVSMSARASISFTSRGISWTKSAPRPSDLPPLGDVENPLYTDDLRGPPRTFTFDGPFQFAVMNELGLIEAVGRVSNLGSPIASP